MLNDTIRHNVIAMFWYVTCGTASVDYIWVPLIPQTGQIDGHAWQNVI